MKGRDVVTRMRSIEDNITGETGQDDPPLDRVVATLLDLEYDGLDEIMLAEVDRVLVLLEDWYSRFGLNTTPRNVGGLAFVQGITFAVAAQRLREDEA